MGSKRVMLKNGLGDILEEESKSASRIVDLFCGAASVSWFAATKLEKTVIAYDLQLYATILAGSIIKRTKAMSLEYINKIWLSKALKTRSKLKGWTIARNLDTKGLDISRWHKQAQEMCASNLASKSSIIWNSYGGHYFSPTQALSFDAMLRTLPEEVTLRELCLAAIIMAASRCAAAPGHTAQPFKSTNSAGPYLKEAWFRDPFHYIQQSLDYLCPLHSIKKGESFVLDANTAANELNPKDIVFVDPPYSGVHYSRFYHVLETIARGKCGKVEGVGRYPPPEERPNSSYSRRDKSIAAIEDLLKSLSEKGCTVILTFPRGNCSNGLSGEMIEKIAKQYFSSKKRSVKTCFSTLGGNKKNRLARKVSEELILVLK